MERRGRIPVAKFRTQEGKTRSRSRVREPDYNEQDPETDLFTLLEDNIALKEANKALKSQLEESKMKQTNLETERYKITERLEEFKKHQEELEAKLENVTVQLKEVQNEKDVLDEAYKTLQGAAVELESSPINSQTQHNVGIVATAALKTKLLQIVFAQTDSAEGEMNEESMANTPLTIDLIEKMVDGFLTLKTSMNAVELQLYEANERISELLENQQHVEQDNEALRTENINLTKVAKLLTENMKESVETSKKMEAALIKLKQRNDDLMAKNRDLIDGPTTSNAVTSTARPDNNATKQLEITEQVEKQNRDHGERIVEMPSEVEAALQVTTNDEQLKSLKLKLTIVEAELREVTARAQLAENELEKYKLLEKEKGKQQQQREAPPTPPPMPDGLLYKASFCLRDSNQVTSEGGVGTAGEYNFPPTNTVLGSCSQIPKLPDRKIIDTVKQQMKPEAATGVDALVRELKTGRVTLRRNRRKTRTNEALQEMFQVLEISQQQNRNSKVCMNLNL